MATLSYEEVRFTVLGPVRAWRGRTELDLGPPQRRALLALLLTSVGRPVSIGEIVDVLWAQEPPLTAVNQVHGHVGALRRLMQPGLAAREAGRWLVRAGGGYLLHTDTENLDLLRYRDLWQQARQLATDGQPQQAAQLAAQALELWQGPAADGIDRQARSHPAFVALDREHAAAAREAADLALLAGVPERILPIIELAAARAPFDEPLQARLVQVLAATGARAEALNVYHTVRARLAAELGIDPGPQLRDAHHWALRGADEADPPPSQPPLSSQPAPHGQPAPPSLPATEPAPRLAQLPADLSSFAGRRQQLAAVAELAGAGLRHAAQGDAATGADAGAAVIVTIGGMAGIGKTTLAVRWAHRIADRFPHGQFYANLRGFDPTGPATSPTNVLCDFLSALGVPPQRIPSGVDAQAALYRSLLTDRRILVLLDNARDVEQVRPLLPGSPGTLTIVTSRSRLSGLVATHGAQPLTLGPLPADEARELLAHRLGGNRVAAEPQAVQDIVSRCAGLPLAVAVTAARAACHPGFPLAALAAELREARDNLDAFTGSDVTSDARTAFSLSYQALSPQAGRLFRLLALHPGPDIAAPAAASLAAPSLAAQSAIPSPAAPSPTAQSPAGGAAAPVRPILAELAQANLIIEHAPGRYTVHDLLRVYATELSRAIDPEPERQAARRRLFDHYLHTAYEAAMLIAPTRETITPAAPEPGAGPQRLADQQQALHWFIAERRVLLAAVTDAAASGLDTHAWQLAWTLNIYLLRQGHWHEWIEVRQAALTAALRLPERDTHATAHRDLGHALSQAGRFAEARIQFAHALDISMGLDDRIGQAHTHRGLGLMYLRLGRHDDVLRHHGQAGELYRQAGNRSGWAKALNESGYAYAQLGDYEQALTCCRQAMTLFAELGDPHGQAATAHSLGYTLRRLGDDREAAAHYRQALELFDRVGDRHNTADTLACLGDIQWSAGEPAAARLNWLRALDILDDLGHPDADQVRAKLQQL